MNRNREPLLIWSSILVALQIIAGGAALGDVVGLQSAGLFILVVAALQGGTQFYVRGLVTPNTNVAAYEQDGEILAGPAATEENGSSVEVVPAV